MGNKKCVEDLIKTRIKDVNSEHMITCSRVWLEVGDVMSKDVISVSPSETIVSAAKSMSENNASCIVVVDNGSVAGIFTETDMLERVADKDGDLSKISVSEIMSCPVESVSADLSVFEAGNIMGTKKIKRLPILKGKDLVGIVTQTDLVRALTSYGMWRDVKEIMTKDVASVQRKESVASAVEIMSGRSISCVVVLEGNKVVGVLTEKDLLKRVVAAQKDPTKTTIEDVMSCPVSGIPPHCSVFSASRMMEKMHIRRLIVMEDERLCGVVTQTDIFRVVKGKLQQEEEKNIKLLDKCKSGIYTIDLDGKTTYVNPAFMKLFGVSEACDFIDQPFLPERFWFDPKDRKKFLKELKNGSVKIKELALKTANGKKIYVTVFSTFTKSIHGEINGSQGILYDVTAKKELVELRETEKALRESERRLTKAELIADFGSWDWDLVTDELRWSEGLCKIFGIASDEFDSKYESFLKLVHPDDLEETKKHIEEAIEGIRPINHDHRIVRADGSERIIHAQAEVTFDENNKAIRVLGTAQDVTDRKQAEEELICAKEQADAANEQLKTAIERANGLAKEAVAADKTKSQFLTSMSHEIRTPMNAIIGFSQVLTEENLTDEQRNHVNIIRESAENLLQLINDILDFSKIEAGKFDVDIVDCSLEYLSAVIESLMRPVAKEKNLDFEILQCGELPAQIRTDPARLRQCLINLVNNAIKFTESGHVYLNVSIQEAGGEKDGESYICFDVEDTGIGIAADKQELIFAEFTQIDGGNSRRYSGTGLGLPITKELTHLLGGELTLSSKEGKGSVFSLRIPAGVDVKSQPKLDKYEFINTLGAEPVSNKQTKFSGRVLVVEDSRTNQMLIKLLLEQLGLEVTIAEDGKEAINKALSESFDLIFMDIQMPNVDGYEATRTLRRKGLKTTIVALTAYAMKGDDDKCLAAGCSNYLPKPIDHKRLRDTIRKYLPAQSGASSEDVNSSDNEADKSDQSFSDDKTSRKQREESKYIRNEECVIDWASVVSICDDEEVIRETAEAILDDGRKSIELIDKAIKSKKLKDVRLYAHRLKGAALSVGAKQLSEKAYRLECAGKEKDAADAGSLFSEVQSEFEKLVSFLSKANWIEMAKQHEIRKQVPQTTGKRD